MQSVFTNLGVTKQIPGNYTSDAHLFPIIPENWWAPTWTLKNLLNTILEQGMATVPKAQNVGLICDQGGISQITRQYSSVVTVYRIWLSNSVWKVNTDAMIITMLIDAFNNTTNSTCYVLPEFCGATQKSLGKFQQHFSKRDLASI